jgi:hypothetical protein
MQEAEDYFLLKLAYQRRDGRRPSMRPKKVSAQGYRSCRHFHHGR